MDPIAVEEAIPALQSALGSEKVVTEDFMRAAYSHDVSLYTRRYTIPGVVVLPESTEDIQEIVRVANCYKIPVVPLGGGTSAWQATETNGGIMIDMSHLNRILEIDETNMALTVEAGANIIAVNKELEKRGLCYPTFPICFGPMTFGAEISKNTGGEIGAMYGHVAKRVNALEVVLGNGEVLVTGSANVLRNKPFLQSGMPDLTQLFVAAEGAYGVITKVTMQMQRVPVAIDGADFKFPATMEGFKSALGYVNELRKRRGTISNAHLFDFYNNWKTERYFTGQGDINDPAQEAAARERLGHAIMVEFASFNSQEECQMKKATALELAKEYGGVYTGTMVFEAYERARKGDTSVTEIVYCGGYAGCMLSSDISYENLPKLYEGHLNLLDELGWPKAWSANSYTFGDDCCISIGSYPWSPRIGNEPVNISLDEWNKTIEKWKILAGKYSDMALAAGAIPYRVGRTWRPYVFDKLEPSYLKYIQSVKNLFDPNNVMNPGVSVFEEVSE